MPPTSFLPPIESWSTWSSLFDDQRLWRPVIDAICDAHGIRYRTIHTPRSNTNAVFLLDRRLILKIYSPFWSEYEIEPRLIEFLSENHAVPVPTIVAAGTYRDRVTWNYLVLESSSGHTLPAIRSEITRADYLAICRQVGLVVRALHDTNVGPLKGLDTGESWDALVDRRRRNALAELTQTQMIGPGIAEELAHTLDHVLAGDTRSPRTLVHGDLESDHILLTRLDGEWKVTCLIDFGDARIGVRDYEWMPLWLGLFDRDIQAMRAFLEAYDRRLLTDHEFPRRLMAWTLLHDFGADAMARLLRRSNVPTPVQTLAQLHEVCWPALPTLPTPPIT
ncbi:MAG: aminoglycoside phosphotransferase family protein [Chloroflexi bacterium]|nr:aminoglycoside phosphotransferase family protein [Chloroflexota bacterium]